MGGQGKFHEPKARHVHRCPVINLPSWRLSANIPKREVFLTKNSLDRRDKTRRRSHLDTGIVANPAHQLNRFIHTVPAQT
jgi:hypothetical protein